MRIVSRSEWGARYANGAGPAPLPAVEGVALHHSTTAAANGPAAIRDLEAIGQSRFGAGISYTFPITVDGTIYEGHGVDRRGAHTGGHNSTVRAICLVGNFEATSPTPAQIDSAARLLAHGVREGWWPSTRLRGHRDFKATACPGAKAYALIPTIVARAQALLDDGAPTPPTPPTPPPAPPVSTQEPPTMMIYRERAARGYVWVVDHAAGTRRHILRPELDAIVEAGGVRHQDPEAKAGWSPPVASDNWINDLTVV